MTRCILEQTFAFYGVNIPPVAVLRKAQQEAGRGSGRHKAKGSAGAAIGYVKHILHQAHIYKILLLITYHTI